MKCVVCGGTIRLSFNAVTDISVSSDCHPVQGRIQIYQCERCGTIQKDRSDSFLENLARIYENYRIYEVSGGHEQVKFENGVPKARSELIIDNVAGLVPNTGDFLDIGTGSGVFLRALSRKLGGAGNLYGQDIHQNEEDKIRSIPTVRDFYHGDISGIQRRFDAVSMIHVLEHVIDPVSFLRQVRGLLKDEGVLIIQVPNIEEASFDAVVYDHVCHFSRFTVFNLARSVFPVCVLPNQQINNEITVVACNSERHIQAGGDVAPPRNVDFERINVVTEYLTNIDSEMGVFGVSPTGTFCGAVLGNRLACFVDEDRNIQFRKHLGKDILPPANVGKSLSVFLPSNKNSTRIKKRLEYLNIVGEDDIPINRQNARI